MNHRPSVFFKPPVPAADYDILSDDYAWDWGGLHLVQLHRFGGDTRRNALSGLPWLAADLKANAARSSCSSTMAGNPIAIERWDPRQHAFDLSGAGVPHWRSDADRAALVAMLKGYNVIGIFHGHEHPMPMIYPAAGLYGFKPVAAFLGGFAVVRVSGQRMDVVLSQAEGGTGEAIFTSSFSKTLPLP